MSIQMAIADIFISITLSLNVQESAYSTALDVLTIKIRTVRILVKSYHKIE